MSLRTWLKAGAAAMSVAGLGFLAGVEGTVYQAYQDPAHGWKVPTICTGHTGPDVYRGQVATPAMCRDWLHNDTQKAVQGVIRCVGHYPLAQHELDALASFSFNVGVSRLCSSTLAKKLQAGDRDGAIKQFDHWRFVTKNGRKVDCRIRSNNCYGLYTRRMAEKHLFATGDYGNAH